MPTSAWTSSCPCSDRPLRSLGGCKNAVSSREGEHPVIIPRGYVDEKQIADGVQRAEAALAPEVVRIRYNLGEDWSGDPSIFFRVLITDEAAESGEWREFERRVEETVLREAHVYELVLLPYLTYRTVSEQALLKEKTWD